MFIIYCNDSEKLHQIESKRYSIMEEPVVNIQNSNGNESVNTSNMQETIDDQLREIAKLKEYILHINSNLSVKVIYTYLNINFFVNIKNCRCAVNLIQN